MTLSNVVPYEVFLVKTLRIFFCDTENMKTDDDFLLFYETKNINNFNFVIWEPLSSMSLDDLFLLAKEVSNDYFNLQFKKY